MHIPRGGIIEKKMICNSLVSGNGKWQGLKKNPDVRTCRCSTVCMLKMRGSTMSSPEYSRCYSIRSAEGAEAEAKAYYPHLHVCTTCGEGKQTASILRGKLEKGGGGSGIASLVRSTIQTPFSSSIWKWHLRGMLGFPTGGDKHDQEDMSRCG